jgi:ornithine cyclodeaminase/alanine dehydrogenase-like protein (mu-crystallin family)
MIVVDAARAAAALPFTELVPALREAFARGCVVPARHVHEPAEGVTSLVMPAWEPGGAYLVKVINIAPGNRARGLPGLHATVLLHDAATGVPQAVIDGDTVTAHRTAAASALAASYLAREDASRLLVVGGGRIAALLPAAYAAVRRVQHVSVWTRRPEAARALAEAWRAAGFDAAAADSLPRACGEADIVSCATLATEPVVRGRWLKAGSHLDLIGSFTPAMREADDDCFRRATLVVDTPEALVKSGELLGPMSRGVFSREDVHATLEQLCRGERPGRQEAAERTVFKSVGSALEDLAAASLVLRAVRQAATASG